MNEKASAFLTLDAAAAADADSLGAAYANADALGAGFDIDSLIDSFGDTKVITHVHVSCVPGSEDAFAEASTANAASSVLEPGNLRFDVLRAEDDPCAFLLVEVYDSPEAAAAHKQTPHYAEWRKEVQEMMAEPRKAITYVARFPEDPGVEDATLRGVMTSRFFFPVFPPTPKSSRRPSRNHPIDRPESPRRPSRQTRVPAARDGRPRRCPALRRRDR